MLLDDSSEALKAMIDNPTKDTLEIFQRKNQLARDEVRRLRVEIKTKQ
jgi:hypothetical protein